MAACRSSVRHPYTGSPCPCAGITSSSWSDVPTHRNRLLSQYMDVKASARIWRRNKPLSTNHIRRSTIAQQKRRNSSYCNNFHGPKMFWEFIQRRRLRSSLLYRHSHRPTSETLPSAKKSIQSFEMRQWCYLRNRRTQLSETTDCSLRPHETLSRNPFSNDWHSGTKPQPSTPVDHDHCVVTFLPPYFHLGRSPPHRKPPAEQSSRFRSVFSFAPLQPQVLHFSSTLQRSHRSRQLSATWTHFHLRFLIFLAPMKNGAMASLKYSPPPPH